MRHLSGFPAMGRRYAPAVHAGTGERPSLRLIRWSCAPGPRPVGPRGRGVARADRRPRGADRPVDLAAPRAAPARAGPPGAGLPVHLLLRDARAAASLAS